MSQHIDLKKIANAVADAYASCYASSSPEDCDLLRESGNQSNEEFFLTCCSILGWRTTEFFIRAALSCIDLCDFNLAGIEASVSIDEAYSYVEISKDLPKTAQMIADYAKLYFPEQASLLYSCARAAEQNARFVQERFLLYSKNYPNAK